MKPTLTVISVKKSDQEIEPVICPECGERVTYGIEVVTAPVRRPGRFAWLRKHSRRRLLCLACFRGGKYSIVAD